MVPPSHMPMPDGAARAQGLDAFLPIADAPALTGAFARRAPMMPWRTDRPVAEAERPGLIADTLARSAAGSRVAYVHIPFCHSHCQFCGFFQNPHDPAAARAMAARLVREIERSVDHALCRDGEPIQAVFLGGGTPTALEADDIAAVVGALKRCLPLATDCEITLEGRAFGLTEDRIEAALGAGVNRISLGVQSFDTKVRRRLGRKLARNDLVAVVADLARRDVTAVIDLIYGLPGQDAAVWRDDVETAIGLELDGLDVYALSIIPHLPLAEAIEKGRTLPVPTLPEQAEAYAFAIKRFADSGWRRLSQAHVARTPRERSLYNRLIKAGASCLAFGPGAGGSAHGRSWRNAADLAEWSRRIDAGEPVIGGMAITTGRRQVHGAIRSQLEDACLDGRSVDELSPGFLSSATPLLEAWARAGLGAFDGATFRTTLAGDFWLTTLAAGLIAASEQPRDGVERRSA